MAKNKPAPQPQPAHTKTNQSTLPDQRVAAGRILRTIFHNLFRYNSARLNSARYESGWRFTITICWREGEPTPCPIAVGHENASRAGHQVDIEFSVSIADSTLLTQVRVDDARLKDSFPSILLGRGHPKELRVLLEKQFGLSYPKVEEEPAG